MKTVNLPNFSAENVFSEKNNVYIVPKNLGQNSNQVNSVEPSLQKLSDSEGCPGASCTGSDGSTCCCPVGYRCSPDNGGGACTCTQIVFNIPTSSHNFHTKLSNRFAF